MLQIKLYLSLKHGPSHGRHSLWGEFLCAKLKTDRLLINVGQYVSEDLKKCYCISSVIRQRFSFQNNPKSIDQFLSYKTDLYFWDCFSRRNPISQQNLAIWGHSTDGNTLFYSQINTELLT